MTDDHIDEPILSVQGAMILDTIVERQNASDTKPIDRGPLTRVEDIEHLYHLFLGREPESDQSLRIGAPIALITRDFASSTEFKTRIQLPWLAGQEPDAPLFGIAPPTSLRRWAAGRLPLTPAGRRQVRQALTWHDLRIAVFADEMFRRRVVDDDSAWQDMASAPAPMPRVGKADLHQLYRVFLGRERDGDSLQDSIGAPLAETVWKFVGSEEFQTAVQAPMIEGRPPLDGRFSLPPSSELRNWAAARLPLSLRARHRVLRATVWYGLHVALFGDDVFQSAAILPESAAATLGAAPWPTHIIGLDIGIENSLLFERDWYLHAYPDVAASGGDPLNHFLQHGMSEGRNPNRLFDTRWYLSAHPQLRAQGINPLVHYLLVGANSGNRPHPFFPAEAGLDSSEEEFDPSLTPLANYLQHMLTPRGGALPTVDAYEVEKAITANVKQFERPELLRHIQTMLLRPVFAVLIDGTSAEELSATIRSLSQQIYTDYKVVSSKSDATCGRYTHLIWLDAGDTLDDETLYRLASELNASPGLDLIYFDHAVTTPSGGSAPLHKPDWSPDYLESFDYIGPAACFTLEKAAAHLDEAENRYDFWLRITETGLRIEHLSRVMLQRPASSRDVSPAQEAADIRAIAGRLKRTGRAGAVAPNQPFSGSYDAKIALRSKPLVSIILPTAGRVINYGGRQIDLIVSCLESFTRVSNYKNTEILIIDNGDLDRDRLAHIEHPAISFLTYDDPEVNIARKINLGASHARGTALLILNDDVEPIAADWIERMLAHLEKPHVGVVGAKLLFPNRTLQHVGMAACDGHLHHVRYAMPADDIGYGFSTLGVRNYIAVTGAVSLVAADKFWDVGGYDERLPIDYNDVDLCYKLLAQGLYPVYEPKAELYHYHGVSVQRTPRPQDFEFFSKRWSRMVVDPFYNQYCFHRAPATFDRKYSERQY